MRNDLLQKMQMIW